MSNMQLLLSRCRELGAEFIPQPDGKLKVRAPAPLPEYLWKELRQRKGELLTLLTGSPSWSCPECKGQVRLEVHPKEAPSRIWTCTTCSTWGATREGAPFPVVWISTRTVQ